MAMQLNSKQVIEVDAVDCARLWVLRRGWASAELLLVSGGKLVMQIKQAPILEVDEIQFDGVDDE